jgi:formylglycine-generating enzyme required for sulfatase activity
VEIGDAGNAADTTTYGAVSYNYRMSIYEISHNAITKATASGMTHVTAGPWLYDRPAATINWFETAAFVNWLNTSTGHQAAYNLSWNGTAWSMALWSSGQAWQAGGENLYRHKDAHYFLPSENEWYKAAYYDPNKAGGDGGYNIYATGSDDVDVPPYSQDVGTDPDTAVFVGFDSGGVWNEPIEVADVNLAGGLSPYGTMAQSGNVREWMESALDGVNNDVNENRTMRGGDKATEAEWLSSARRYEFATPMTDNANFGFRVASLAIVPEPSSGLLLLLGGAACWVVRRRR